MEYRIVKLFLKDIFFNNLINKINKNHKMLKLTLHIIFMSAFMILLTGETL